MALKVYKKSEIIIHSKPQLEKEIVIKPIIPRRKISMWDLLKSAQSEFVEFLTLSRIASITVPLILIVFGVSILYKQLWPEVEQFVREKEHYLDQGTTALVAGDYIEDRQAYLSNPGSDYFKSLSSDAFGQNVIQEDTVSRSYKGKFYLSIPSLNLKELPVTANVDSGNEQEYKSVLQSSLAHMAGTGLPISTVENNMVIYGHSANGNYYERTQDPAGAFSRLQKIKIGDEIIIKIDGKEYKYKVTKTKIVNPEDVSIVTGTPGKSTLTLFTCFPNGNPAKRFIAVARPVE